MASGLFGSFESGISRVMPLALACLIAFAVSAFYSYCIVLYPTGVSGSFFTVCFIGAGLFWLFQELNRDEQQACGWSLLGAELLVSGIYLGIGAGAFAAGAGDHVFWLADSISTHVPMVERMIAIINEGRFISEFKSLAPGTTTHFLTALSFSVFGKSVYSALLALLVLKMIAVAGVFSLARLVFNPKVARLATAVYCVAPTVFFYTITLYKEAAIHAMVAWGAYGAALFYKKLALRALLFFLLPLLLLYFERIYLPALFSLTAFILILSLERTKKIAGLVICGLGALLAVHLGVFDWINFEEGFEIFRQLRARHMEYSDFSKEWNYGVPFPLAALKALLTPFFTISKFSIFSEFSYLLIWGSFIHQALISIGFWGWFWLWKNEPQGRWLHSSLVAPLLLLVLILGYVAPWAGRIRDSFYPVIAIYAAFGLSQATPLIVNWWRSSSVSLAHFKRIKSFFSFSSRRTGGAE